MLIWSCTILSPKAVHESMMRCSGVAAEGVTCRGIWLEMQEDEHDNLCLLSLSSGSACKAAACQIRLVPDRDIFPDGWLVPASMQAVAGASLKSH